MRPGLTARTTSHPAATGTMTARVARIRSGLLAIEPLDAWSALDDRAGRRVPPRAPLTTAEVGSVGGAAEADRRGA